MNTPLKMLAVISALALTACAPMQFRPSNPNLSAVTPPEVMNQDLAKAKFDCRMVVRQAAQGRWVSGGLIFIAIVAATYNASDRELYASCMSSRGFTVVEPPLQ